MTYKNHILIIETHQPLRSSERIPKRHPRKMQLLVMGC